MARPRKQRDDEDARAKADLRCSVSRIAFLAGVSPATISNARATQGLPKNRDGTMSWPTVRAWAQARELWGYGSKRAAAAPVDDVQAAIERLKLAKAQRENDQAMGTLIPRVEAITAQIRLALEFKATLLQMPDQLSTALANRSAREVEAILRERVGWILGRAQDGNLPLSADLVARIAELVTAEVATA